MSPDRITLIERISRTDGLFVLVGLTVQVILGGLLLVVALVTAVLTIPLWILIVCSDLFREWKQQIRLYG